MFASFDRRRFLTVLAATSGTYLAGSAVSAHLVDCCVASRLITLADGRRLGLAEYGDPAGIPVLYFHGLPASKLEARAFDSEARATGCRVISIDRPGIGHSDLACGRRIMDWPNDVAEVVRKLGLKEFYVIGFSSGAPYAVACAIAFSRPDQLPKLGSARLVRSIVTCGVAPPEASLPHGSSERFWRLVRKNPGLAEKLLEGQTRALRRNPDRVLRRLTKKMSLPSQRVSQNQFYRQVVIDAYFNAVRCGPSGLVGDARIVACPWSLDTVACQLPVDLWYGNCDRIAPITNANYWHRVLPNSRLFVLEGEGHYSTPAGANARRILEESVLAGA